MSLTSKQSENFKYNKDKDRFLDEDGLHLRISAMGHKSFQRKRHPQSFKEGDLANTWIIQKCSYASWRPRHEQCREAAGRTKSFDRKQKKRFDEN